MRRTRTDYVLTALLLIPGVIHLIPLAGVLGQATLSRVYGLDFSDPNLEILMRHRSVLFGLLGALLVVAAFRPAHRSLALVAGLVSTLSFLGLAWQVGDYSAILGRVVAADMVAIACLVVAAGLHWGRRQKSRFLG